MRIPFSLGLLTAAFAQKGGRHQRDYNVGSQNQSYGYKDHQNYHRIKPTRQLHIQTTTTGAMIEERKASVMTAKMTSGVGAMTDITTILFERKGIIIAIMQALEGTTCYIISSVRQTLKNQIWLRI